MKYKYLILIFSCLLIARNVSAQKYRTLEQYQNYFIKNYENIDEP
jgi:hypothetical protein